MTAQQNKMYTPDGWTLFDGNEGFNVGDKIEFILGPDHVWNDAVPMAVATIVDMDKQYPTIAVQGGDEVYIAISLEPIWSAMVRKVSDDTEETVGYAASIRKAGNVEARKALEEKATLVLKGIAEHFEKELFLRLMQKLAEAFEESVSDTEVSAMEEHTPPKSATLH